MIRSAWILLWVLLLLWSATTQAEVLRLDYDGFTVWVDCARRGAIMFRYHAQRDVANIKRLTTFYHEPALPADCQQSSTASYRRPKGAKPTYDRGHLVPANHLDDNPVAIRQSNRMTNILPQVAQMNRGAWRHSEDIIECYRDIDDLLVIGGVLWGEHSADDYFMPTHGIATPDAFWKVIIRSDGRVIGWVIPNSSEATYKNLDRYLVSAQELEERTGVELPVAAFRKQEVPQASWLIPRGCDRG